MPDAQRQTDLIGWAGFTVFVAGLAAVGLPGSASSVWVNVGLVMTGVGVAVILIYLTRKLRARGGSRER